MQYFRIILIVSTLFAFGCNSKKDRPAEEKVQQYAFITNIIERPDSTYLDADYIQYLTGDSAVAAAAKKGDLDTTQNADGTVSTDVVNDYYILNDNKRVRRIPIATDCRYDLLLSMDRVVKINENSLESLKKIYKETPFLLTIENGEIIEVKEVFIP